jgi:hypothetical protein
MENRKLQQHQGAVEGPISAPGTSDLLHHVSAISRALKNWNDTEALKLLRLHWPEISRALCKPELLKGIPVVVPRQSALAYDQVMDSSAADDLPLPALSLPTTS